MKLIPLCGRLGEGKFAKVDDEDFSYLSRFNWQLREGSTPGGHDYFEITAPLGIDDSRHTRYGLPMWRLLKRKPSRNRVLHLKDGDVLNMQKENIDFTDHVHSHAKQRKRIKPCTSKYKGVCRPALTPKSCKSRPWLANVCKNGVKYRLGSFATEEEAAHAYDAKAIELFGLEYARLNFPVS